MPSRSGILDGADDVAHDRADFAFVLTFGHHADHRFRARFAHKDTAPAAELVPDLSELAQLLLQLEDEPVIVAIEVPRLSTGATWAYHKINRKTGEFANAIGVAILDQKSGLSRVLAGATDGSPVVLPKTAARLAEAGEEAACLLVAEELAEAMPASEIDARELHAVAVRRALMQMNQERS